LKRKPRAIELERMTPKNRAIAQRDDIDIFLSLLNRHRAKLDVEAKR